MGKELVWSGTREKARVAGVAGTELGNFFPGEGNIPAVGKRVETDLAAF